MIRVDINPKDCSVARVLINTAVFSFINRWICFSLDEIIFDVHVKETIGLPCDQDSGDKQSILVNDRLKHINSIAMGGEPNESEEDDRADESSHDRRKKDFGDGEKHLLQSILHSSQKD